jgi:hypothetical protein
MTIASTTLILLADIASPSPSPSSSHSLLDSFPGGLWAFIGVFSVLFTVLYVALIIIYSWRSSKERREREDKLERAQSNEDLKEYGPLFKLYNEQLRIYQNETRERARQSFSWAIGAMMVGFGVLAVGACLIIFHPNQEGVLSGGSLAAIGGALSAFITKTLLDVHKLSLIQLNHYFKQPVLNSHVLTCVRLIKAIPAGPSQEGLYKTVIQEIVELLAAEQAQSVILEDTTSRLWPRARRKAKGKELKGKEDRFKKTGGASNLEVQA